MQSVKGTWCAMFSAAGVNRRPAGWPLPMRLRGGVSGKFRSLACKSFSDDCASDSKNMRVYGTFHFTKYITVIQLITY